MRRLIICTLLILAVCATAASARTRVLFVGNSHTQFNDMPGLFAGLAEAAGHVVNVDQATVGGYSLEQHLADAVSRAKIAAGPWDLVFLQEHSIYPVIDYMRENSFYPAARALDSLIDNYGSRTAFFMTWGRPDGGLWCIDGHCSPNFRDYFAMQDVVRDAYSAISEETDAMLAPVGVAWSMALEKDPQSPLWTFDQAHPSLEGSYLAACVVFTSVFAESPEGLEFYGGLDPARALFYQQVAGDQSVPTEKMPLGSVKAMFRDATR